MQVLALADRLKLGEGAPHERSCVCGVAIAVEEGVDVRGYSVNDRAQRVGVFLKDVDRFGGGDGPGIPCGGESEFCRGDETREMVGGAEFVEDGFVADDDHFHGAVVAVGPGGDVGDLFLRACCA